MLIMDGTEIKKLALGGQEFIKKPDSTDYWDYYVGTIIYDIALSSDENYLYIFYSTGIQKVDRKGNLIWTYNYPGSKNISVGTVTSDGFVLYSDNSSNLYSLKDNGQNVSLSNIYSFPHNITALAADSAIKTFVGTTDSNVALCDTTIKNSKPETLFQIENATYRTASLFLINDVLIASSSSGKILIYYLNTKNYKSVNPFSGTVSDDANVFASSNGNNIICSGGTVGKIVLLDMDLNIVKSSNLSGFRSCLIINGYIYANSLNSTVSTYCLHKYDLDFNELMHKIYLTSTVSKIIYSEKDDAIYMSHDAYQVGKFSTYFA